MSIIDTLITDRTEADVKRFRALAKKGWHNLTTDERGEWLRGKLVPLLDADGQQVYDKNGEPLYCRDGVQRGTYSASDLNRVGEAVQYLADLLNGRGYSVSVSPKMDWERADFPRPTQMERYLADVAAIRDAIALPASVPAAPADMERLTWQEANEIEQILVAVDQMLANMAAAWLYSGDIYAGDV